MKRIVSMVLLLALLLCGCRKGNAFNLPKEYYGTSWVCTDPYATFHVNDDGYCYGTLVFNGATIPALFCFRVRLSQRSGFIQFFANGKGESYHLFNGEFQVIGDTMVVTGEWSAFVEEIYHQPYEKGECTLIFSLSE